MIRGLAHRCATSVSGLVATLFLQLWSEIHFSCSYVLFVLLGRESYSCYGYSGQTAKLRWQTHVSTVHHPTRQAAKDAVHPVQWNSIASSINR